jgi:Alpha-amylase/alpha-mannosidase
MKLIVMFLEAHQPRRLSNFRYQDIGIRENYFWDEKNKEIIKRISQNSYIPTLSLLKDYSVPITLSFSGILLEQLWKYEPTVPDLLKEYFKASGGEMAIESYYHSLSSIWNPERFLNEVRKDMDIKKEIYDKDFRTFRNTEMIYSDKIDEIVNQLNVKNILTEGTDSIISKYNPNFIYKTPFGHNIFLRNYRLSDDISFRFSNREWNEYPLFSEKYLNWLSNSPGDVINLFMDFETFGEHQRKETGIFEFLEAFIERAKDYNLKFATVNEAAESITPRGQISIKEYISWADIPRDMSAWLGNELQKDLFEILKSLEKCIPEEIYNYLLTSDHFYYVSLGTTPDITVHSYFNPYGSAYDAYINFRNILEDLRLRYCNGN